jgi:hypothetical protein
MRVKQGGTRIYCPNCKEETICSSRSLERYLDDGTGQHWEHTRHPDLQWFRRGRHCLTCLEDFVTAEVTEKFIDELVELRDALAAIKASVTSFTKQSQRTAKSLASLDSTLATLKALKVYEAQKVD